MAITQIGAIVRTDFSAASASLAVALPAGLAANDVALLAICTPNGRIAATTGQPAGIQANRFYAQFDDGTVDGQPDADGDATITLLAYVVPATLPTTVSIPLNIASDGKAFAVAFRGADTVAALGLFANRNKYGADTTNVPCPEITPTFDGAMIIRGALLQNTVVTAPAGAAASAVSTITPLPGAGLAVMGAQTTATATGVVNFTTTSSSDFGAGWTLAIRPAAPTTPPAGGWQLGSIAA